MPPHELGKQSADATAADSVEQVECLDLAHGMGCPMAWVAHVLTCCEGPASLGFASRVSDKAAGPVELPVSAPTVPDWCSTPRAKCLVNGFHKDLCCESFERCELRMLAGVQAPVAASGCAACASQLTTASFASLPIPRPSWASPD